MDWEVKWYGDMGNYAFVVLLALNAYVLLGIDYEKIKRFNLKKALLFIWRFFTKQRTLIQAIGLVIASFIVCIAMEIEVVFWPISVIIMLAFAVRTYVRKHTWSA